MATTIILIAASTAVSMIAASMNKPKEGATLRDNRLTTVAQRGTFIPYIIGRRRIAPTFLWAGSRVVEEVSSGGGKNMGGGGGGGYQFWESASHAICLGPVDTVYGVYQAGKLIVKTPVDLSNSNGGEVVTIDHDEDSKVKFWPGTANQIVNADLADAERIGLNCRWKHLAYAWWCPKYLGGSPQWPDIQYDVRVLPKYRLTRSPVWMNETAQDAGNAGVNPAHALWQIITAPYPHGVGVPKSMVDREAFEKLGELLHEEHLPCNIVATDGRMAYEMIADLMADFGITMPQVGSKIFPTPVRDQENLVTLTGDDFVASEPEITRVLEEDQPDRLVFLYSDNRMRFREVEIVKDDDAVATSRLRPNPRRVAMPCITDRRTAVKTANRRMLEAFSSAHAFKLNITRGARRFRPGQAFIADGIGQLRVATLSLKTNTTRATIDAIVDPYGDGYEDYLPGDIDQPPLVPDDMDPAADVMMKPLVYNGKLYVLRVRAHDQIAGAIIYLSRNDANFFYGNTQNVAASGVTLDAGIINDPADIENGPTVTEVRVESGRVLNLTADTEAWALGKQLVVIDDEVMYLRELRIVQGGFQLIGLKRGKFGSAVAAHNASAPCFIIQQSDLKPITSELITNGVLYVKAGTFTVTAQLDLSLVSSASVTIP